MFLIVLYYFELGRDGLQFKKMGPQKKSSGNTGIEAHCIMLFTSIIYVKNQISVKGYSISHWVTQSVL